MGYSQYRTAMIAGFTAVFIGYFLVWLPGPSVGLQFIGVELGEWIKFLGVGQNRNLFYLPPITLGLMLLLLSLTWPYKCWRAWVLRIIALSVALLALPAIEAIRFEPASEWFLRLVLVGLVFLLFILSRFLVDKLRSPYLMKSVLVSLTLVGLVGAILPFLSYLMVRPIVSQAIKMPIGIGLGVWFNTAGHLLVTAVTFFQLVPPKMIFGHQDKPGRA